MNCFFDQNTITGLLDKDNGIDRIISLKGKSTFIKHRLISDCIISAKKQGYYCNKFLSKYDYDKFCAAYIKSKKLLIIDSELLKNLYQNIDLIQINTDELFGISEFSDSFLNLFSKKALKISDAEKYEESAAVLLRENALTFSRFADKAKILNYVLRFMQRNALRQSNASANENMWTISNITPWGIHTCYETVAEFGSDIFIISDCTKHIASALINGFSCAFIQCGKSVEKCVCSLCPEYAEHLLIPELSLAFVCENNYHSYPYDDTAVISSHRFLKFPISKTVYEQTRKNEIFAENLIDKSVFSLFDALETDNEINNYLLEFENSESYEKTSNFITKHINT